MPILQTENLKNTMERLAQALRLWTVYHCQWIKGSLSPLSALAAAAKAPFFICLAD